MHFGEYELSPSLIGLSPLPTGHPKTFQRLQFGPPVLLRHFNLPWVDHSVSRLPPLTIRPIQTRFRYGSVLKYLTLPVRSNS
jgi:hypothetical protein